MIRAACLAAVFGLSSILPVTAAKAAVFTLSFEVTEVLGARKDLLGESFTGTVEVDSFLIGANDSVIVPGSLLDLDLDFFGADLTEVDEVSFPEGPEFTFDFAEPVFADAIFFQVPSLLDVGVLEVDIDSALALDGSSGAYLGSARVVSLAAIPGPAALPLLASGLVLFGLLRRRRLRAV